MDDISEELLSTWSRRKSAPPTAPREFVRGEDGMYRIGVSMAQPEQPKQTMSVAPPMPEQPEMTGRLPGMPAAEPVAPAAPHPPIVNHLLGNLADDLLSAFQGIPAGSLEHLPVAPDDISSMLADDSVSLEDRLRMAQAMADRQGIMLGIRRAEPGPNGEQPQGAFEAVVIDPETAAQLPEGYAKGVYALGKMLGMSMLDPVVGSGAAVYRATQGVKGADRVMASGVGLIDDLKKLASKQKSSAEIAAARETFTSAGGRINSFGPVYEDVRGDYKAAVKKLAEMQDGEAPGVLSHPEIGDITLPWGKPGTGKSNGEGLAKLIKFHPEVIDDLPNIVAGMSIKSRTANRINLESADHRAGVRLDYDGQEKTWLLSAYQIDENYPRATVDRRAAPRDGAVPPAEGNKNIPPSGANSNGGSK